MFDSFDTKGATNVVRLVAKPNECPCISTTVTWSWPIEPYPACYLSVLLLSVKLKRMYFVGALVADLEMKCQ